MAANSTLLHTLQLTFIVLRTLQLTFTLLHLTTLQMQLSQAQIPMLFSQVGGCNHPD